MNAKTRRVALVVLAAASLAAGCSRDHGLSPTHSPTDPAGGAQTPPVPTDILATTGNRSVTLSWGLPDSGVASSVRMYRIYKQSSETEPAEIADSSRTSPKALIDLSNGRAIRLSVSAVLTNGLEGRRSAEVEVSPGLIAITIDDGKDVTLSREVGIALSAPSGANAVTLGSQPDMSDGITLSYATRVTWTLTDGDGTKTVYARVTDGLGNPSQILSDTIRLDTKAEIVDFGFDGSDIRVPGDAIVFRLRAGEALGTAEVEIPRGGTRRTMRDDGIAPDQTAADGVYTLEYIAESSRQFLGGEVLGLFKDEAGNRAPEHPASRRLTVHAAPPAVVLLLPRSGDPQEITLDWSRAPEGAPFGSYRIYRDDSPGVAQSPSRRLINEVTNAEEITYTDETVEPGRTYFYIVELVDPLGASTPSNEVSGSSKSNTPPVAVVLAAPYGITEKSVSLAWSRNEDADFRLYRVLRAERPNVAADPTRRTLTEITDRASVSYVDETEVEEGRIYYYVVETVDELGLGAVSNERTATLDDLYPTAVELSAPEPSGETTVGLVWTRNSDRDFDSYRIYRSDTGGVDESDDLVTELLEVERTQWVDGALIENSDYYYRLFVRDKGGHSTPGNEIKVTTANAKPAAIALNVPAEVAGTATPTLDLSWSASTAHDFEAYHVYRDTSPAVGESSTLVRAVDTATTTTYRDAGLDDNTRYYYRVFVLDDAGGSTGSAERSIVTANRAPTPVTLSVAGATTTSISLSWTRNVNADFFEYRLLRGSAPAQINQIVATFSMVEQTTYTDFLPGQSPNTDVFYKVVVVDKDIDDTTSLTSDSNIVSARVKEQ